MNMKRIWAKRFHLNPWSLGILSLLWVALQSAFAQPTIDNRKELQVRLGEVTFRLREIGAKPSPFKLLELHVTVFNQDRREVLPPNTVTVVARIKAAELSEGSPGSREDEGTVEATLNASLPPLTGRVVVLGFPLPEGKSSAVTFEVQVNPPHGELKRITWPGQ